MLESEFKTLVAEALRVAPESITYETHFMRDLGADSLDILRLVNSIESSYGVQVDDMEIQSLATFGHAFEYALSRAPLGNSQA